MDKYWTIFGDKKIQTQTRTAEEILDEGTDDEMDETKIIGDLAKYETKNFWLTEDNPEGIISAHLEELVGKDKNNGVWALMAERFPDQIGKYEDYVSFNMVRNNYMSLMHSANEVIPDDIQKIFIKIDAMNRALDWGIKYKKKSSKSKLKD